MNNPNIIRMVTDPKTGERTAMVTTTGAGQAVWKLSAEEDADKKAAIAKGQAKLRDLERFRKAVR